MSYYTEYRTIMDEFAWNRLLGYWKNTKDTDVDMGIYPSDETYTRHDRYLIKNVLNHGPCMDDVTDWIYSKLGVSSIHYKIFIREENWDYWSNDGQLGTDYCPNCDDDTAGWKKIEVDISSDSLPQESDTMYLIRIIELLEELNENIEKLTAHKR